LSAGSCGAVWAQDAQHVFLRLADRQAADRIAVEVHAGQFARGLVAQVLEHAALHDAIQRVGIAGMRCLGALGPAQAHPHRIGGLALGGGVGRAFVKDHHDVGIQRALDLHRNFGRQEQLVAVDRRLRTSRLPR
jgi:hypothetical protein